MVSTFDTASGQVDMCRHLGYVGPPVPVGELLVRGPYSLRVQSWAPRQMRGGGTINADGFGVAWWRTAEPAVDGGEPAVSRYRNPTPIWTDPAVEEVLPQLVSPAVLAAVRSATVGMPVERAACAPFAYGHWAFSHNGLVPDWRTVLTAVLADLDGTATRSGHTRLFQTLDLLEAESPTDSAALWVLLRRLLDPVAATATAGLSDIPADPTAVALRLLVTTVLRHAPDSGLNLLLGDGDTLWATTWFHTLWALVTDDYAILASEPYDDDPRWQSLPDRSVVRAEPGRLVVEPLDSPDSARPDAGARTERAAR